MLNQVLQRQIFKEDLDVSGRPALALYWRLSRSVKVGALLHRTGFWDVDMRHSSASRFLFKFLEE